MDKINTKIFLIDDDEEIRQSISLLLKSAGYNVETFATKEKLLKTNYYKSSNCILLDVLYKGKTGLDIQTDIKSNLES